MCTPPWVFSHNSRFLAYRDPHDETDLLVFDLQNYETTRLDPGTARIDALHWSGDDDYLLLELDEMGISGSIWALPVQSGGQPHMLLERGVLLDALPAPVKKAAPGTAVDIPIIAYACCFEQTQPYNPAMLLSSSMAALRRTI